MKDRSTAVVFTFVKPAKVLSKLQLDKAFRAWKKGKNSLKYDDRVLKRMKEDTGTHHNFPTSFDKKILSNKPSVVRSDGRSEYLHTGSINNQKGIYHITLKDDVVTHRSFIPQSDWKRYSNRWDLPPRVTP
ncbi:hypothetical protein QR721_12835 [Aciduricibacillus chroicocephali]|uniref:Uncharacterized protein n=1 Tax=Aciduricibacillus chroicocephali TaxID=3054939 RepID=A0ABY9KUT6_9BACI|nr:hypothetical protein QR721_12835 [Bacillaceae bacterium 44XB]